MHLFNGAWLPEKNKNNISSLYKFYYNKYDKIYPNFIVTLLVKIIVNYRIEGFIGCIKKLLKKIKI